MNVSEIPEIDSEQDDIINFAPKDDSETISMEIECVRPQTKHAATIRKFLTDNMPHPSGFNASHLALNIAKQEFVGSCIFASVVDDIIAFLSVLSLQKYHNLSPIQKIHSYLKNELPTNVHRFIDELFDENAEKPNCVLFNERIINTPVQVIPPTFNSLREELEWAVEDGVMEYDFEWFIYITKKANDNENEDEELFFKFEDEIFEEEAEYVFPLPVMENNPQHVTFGTVYIFNMEQFKGIVEKLLEHQIEYDSFALQERAMAV
ncbi:hypothetical protein PCE1_003057 [Barthelona sp. PCE]